MRTERKKTHKFINITDNTEHQIVLWICRGLSERERKRENIPETELLPTASTSSFTSAQATSGPLKYFPLSVSTVLSVVKSITAEVARERALPLLVL